MKAKTNMNEVIKNVQALFNEILSTDTMVSIAKATGQNLKYNTIDHMKNSQTGRLKTALNMEQVNIKKPGKISATTKTAKLTIGYGDIEALTFETLREWQKAVFKNPDGTDRTIWLKPEKFLPSWIIMEFGRRAGSGVGMPANMPKMFDLGKVGGIGAYDSDSSKQFLFGPSKNRIYKKHVFFMTNRKESTSRTHPGIKAQEFFRKGLADSKEALNEDISLALRESARELASKYGGEVI